MCSLNPNERKRKCYTALGYAQKHLDSNEAPSLTLQSFKQQKKLLQDV